MLHAINPKVLTSMLRQSVGRPGNKGLIVLTADGCIWDIDTLSDKLHWRS